MAGEVPLPGVDTPIKPQYLPGCCFVGKMGRLGEGGMGGCAEFGDSECFLTQNSPTNYRLARLTKLKT
ncbi:MAG TPA: hypothetical protein DD379_17550, partial [Cyanobacteria bacterium UBA11162]|nr:hypothetical protein [Cyanobacteria bacterium UBA11162]